MWLLRKKNWRCACILGEFATLTFFNRVHCAGSLLVSLGGGNPPFLWRSNWSLIYGAPNYLWCTHFGSNFSHMFFITPIELIGPLINCSLVVIQFYLILHVKKRRGYAQAAEGWGREDYCCSGRRLSFVGGELSFWADFFFKYISFVIIVICWYVLSIKRSWRVKKLRVVLPL